MLQVRGQVMTHVCFACSPLWEKRWAVQKYWALFLETSSEALEWLRWNDQTWWWDHFSSRCWLLHFPLRSRQSDLESWKEIYCWQKSQNICRIFVLVFSHCHMWIAPKSQRLSTISRQLQMNLSIPSVGRAGAAKGSASFACCCRRKKAGAWFLVASFETGISQASSNMRQIEVFQQFSFCFSDLEDENAQQPVGELDLI